MTAHAREVLRDCETLFAELSQQPLWGPMFRLRLANLLSLLRAVGDVAKKVDGKATPEARQATDRAWRARDMFNPDALIFWEFIKAERDNILKAYKFGAGVNKTFRPGGETTDNAFMRSGPFAGRDPLELCKLAIEYWRTYLDEIDAEIARSARPQPLGRR